MLLISYLVEQYLRAEVLIYHCELGYFVLYLIVSFTCTLGRW